MHIGLDKHAPTRRTQLCGKGQGLYFSVRLEFQDAL